MKAQPPLPTLSTREVAQIGAQSIAAGTLRDPQRAIGATARITVPLRVETAPCGLPVLVHAETGERLGFCASAMLAESTRVFFAE